MESERGIHANTEHVYDIELPTSFEPLNSDGEVQGFVFVDIQVKKYNMLIYLFQYLSTSSWHERSYYSLKLSCCIFQSIYIIIRELSICHTLSHFFVISM